VQSVGDEDEISMEHAEVDAFIAELEASMSFGSEAEAYGEVDSFLAEAASLMVAEPSSVSMGSSDSLRSSLLLDRELFQDPDQDPDLFQEVDSFMREEGLASRSGSRPGSREVSSRPGSRETPRLAALRDYTPSRMAPPNADFLVEAEAELIFGIDPRATPSAPPPPPTTTTTQLPTPPPPPPPPPPRIPLPASLDHAPPPLRAVQSLPATSAIEQAAAGIEADIAWLLDEQDREEASPKQSKRAPGLSSYASSPSLTSASLATPPLASPTLASPTLAATLASPSRSPSLASPSRSPSFSSPSSASSRAPLSLGPSFGGPTLPPPPPNPASPRSVPLRSPPEPQSAFGAPRTPTRQLTPNRSTMPIQADTPWRESFSIAPDSVSPSRVPYSLS